MPEPRQYKAAHYNAEGRMEWEFATANAEEAIGHFFSGMAAVGHTDQRIEQIRRHLLVSMTEGKDFIIALDPDYKGQMKFTRIATN